MEIREAYDIIRAHNGSDWVSIETLHAMIGGSFRELADKIRQLVDTDEHFRAEPQPFGHRITEQSRRYAVKIGGEDRHLIAWY
ncbi:hypothetical protein [Paractinoplanes atraurantiacus]|uniref:Uncharacterized protein n=1 Tax=Paractinoplanes atraurantiacus TaxID=1036182 RepID=A0A285H0L2_9ACTN|nr:hypothetical protein [Actinoplanes atraurantiacus]SNY29103.1 hypothetical protein SAMN05421748_103192 [Actinoplanes atraurantiacus]